MNAPRVPGLIVALAFAGAAATASAALGATFYVDQRSASCSEGGPGTAADPYCSISAAIAARGAPGNTILVLPGTYREQVTLAASGTAESPLVVRALGVANDPVIVSGSNDYSSPVLWDAHSQDVWVAASVNWAPAQVFANGARLAASGDPPASLPAGSFTWFEGGGLYVNVGGGNPGLQRLEVGRRPYGFLVSNRSHVAIDGFEVTQCEDRGVQLTDGAHHVDVLRGSVTFSGRFGIQANSCSAVRIGGNTVSGNADHGVSLIGGTTASTIEGNTSSGNGAPGRSANGIYLLDSPANVVRANRLHDNQDTGLQFLHGANDNLSVHNLSWNNGDHGFDHLRVTGTRHVGDVAWGNARDGFSIEGNATGHSLHNCIATDNGLATAHFNLMVDDSSSVGFVSDDNLFWNSTAQAPIRYRAVVYPTVSAFSAASGGDTRTLQVNPRFVSPAQGDFHLLAGSPAIDNANSGVSGWSAVDADGNARGDDPSIPNQGMGPITVADRGALEYTAGGIVAVDPPAPDAGGAGAGVAPNPMESHATLEFATASAGPLRVGLFDLGGRLIRSLVDVGDAPAGPHRVPFEARTPGGEPLNGGVYFYRIESAGRSTVGRFVVVR